MWKAPSRGMYLLTFQTEKKYNLHVKIEFKIMILVLIYKKSLKM